MGARSRASGGLAVVALALVMTVLPAAAALAAGASPEPTLPAGDDVPLGRILPGILLIAGGLAVLLLVRTAGGRKRAGQPAESERSPEPEPDQADAPEAPEVP
jgi:hypothetical protein